MQRDSKVLIEATEQYYLDMNGVKFWTPYWINWDAPPYFIGAPYTGKGTPGQVERALRDRLMNTDVKPKTGEDYRRFMRDSGIGIDCSAIVYHLLAKMLRQNYALKLPDYVMVPKSEVIAFSTRPLWQKAGVSAKLLDSLPDHISITKLHQLFGVNLRWSANVSRLSSLQTAVTVKRLADIRPGDLIKMSGIKYVHLVIVVKVESGRITYVDSSREWGRYGGVRFVDIKIKAPQRGIEEQDWDDKRFFFPEKGDRVCRLRVIDERTSAV